MKINKMALVLVILGLTVGFAAITTTLSITGTATIRANTDDFRDNVVFKEGSVSATSGTATIGAGGKSITFNTNTFSSIGDNATVTFTVENTSYYNAKFGNPAIECQGTGTYKDYFNEYIQVTLGTELNGAVISRNGAQASSINVRMKKSFVEDQVAIGFTCTLSVEAEETGA